MELAPQLQGNPVKGEMPTWEMATFQTENGLNLITVWRNTATGLMEASLATRPHVSASWGSPTRFSHFG